jgi:predicted branched-subunit amino acid permease
MTTAGREAIPSVRSVLAICLPAAAAIAIFGALYGAGARPALGATLTIASSVFVFSGSLQFALVGLLGAGAATPALLVTTVTLNLRHLVMGAVLRPRLGDSRAARAALAFLLVDETFGFAVAAGESARQAGLPSAAAVSRTLMISGLACYLAWVVGTIVGVLGAGLAAVQGIAGAIFPVLFIGLASMAATTRGRIVRAVGAAALTVGIVLVMPELRPLAPVLAGIAVALPGRDA